MDVVATPMVGSSACPPPALGLYDMPVTAAALSFSSCVSYFLPGTEGSQHEHSSPPFTG